MNLPNRKCPRLTGYNYAKEGYYFITICTYNRHHLFGEINLLNEIGMMAENELNNIPTYVKNATIDQYVIMPNHIHCIAVIGRDTKAERSRPFPTLSTIIGLYKSGVSRRVHRIYPDLEVWQKSFHDHIIRNEEEYQKIWKYIEENPARWAEDCYFVKGDEHGFCRERS